MSELYDQFIEPPQSQEQKAEERRVYDDTVLYRAAIESPTYEQYLTLESERIKKALPSAERDAKRTRTIDEPERTFER